MIDAKVIWKGHLSFSGTANSGFEVPLGADAAVGGNDDGFRPMELLATGLAGCTAMDVVSLLGKKRQEVTAFDVAVHAEQAAEHPRVFTHASLEYHVYGHNIDEAAVVRAIELSTLRYCPAQAMFSKVFPLELKYQIFEDEGEGKHQLVKSGVYIPAPEKAA